MLINLMLRTIIDFSYAPGQLHVTINTENKPGCGVFDGDGVRLPVVKNPFTDDQTVGVGADEIETFHIICPKSAPLHQIRQHHFASIQWKNSVYVQHPFGEEICVVEHNTVNEHFWTTTFRNMEFVIPDYGLQPVDIMVKNIKNLGISKEEAVSHLNREIAKSIHDE